MMAWVVVAAAAAGNTHADSTGSTQPLYASLASLTAKLLQHTQVWGDAAFGMQQSSMIHQQQQPRKPGKGRLCSRLQPSHNLHTAYQVKCTHC